MIPRIFLRSFVSDSHLFDAVSPENHGTLSTPGDDFVSAFLVRQWIHGDVSTETLEKFSIGPPILRSMPGAVHTWKSGHRFHGLLASGFVRQTMVAAGKIPTFST